MIRSTRVTLENLHTVHVEREERTAKLWLDPVRLQRSRGFRSLELQRIRRIVEARAAAEELA
jgi:hypothetical protein